MKRYLFILLFALALPCFAAAQQTAEQVAIERKVNLCVDKRMLIIESVAANMGNPVLREKDKQTAYKIFATCYPGLGDSISYKDFPRIAIEGSPVSTYARAEIRHLCAVELRQAQMDIFFDDYLQELFKLIDVLEKK